MIHVRNWADINYEVNKALMSRSSIYILAENLRKKIIEHYNIERTSKEFVEALI
jgi:hypothetical protein